MSDEKMVDVAEMLDIDDTSDQIVAEIEQSNFDKDFQFLIDDVKKSMKDLDKEIDRLYDEMKTEESNAPQIDDFEKGGDFQKAQIEHKKLRLMERRYKLKCAETVAKMVTAKKQYAQHLMDLYSKKRTIDKKSDSKSDDENSVESAGLTATEIKEMIAEAKNEKELF